MGVMTNSISIKDSYFMMVNIKPSLQIIDEADRMIDSMHQSWLSQVTKAVYRSKMGSEAVSIFKRTEPALITTAR